jgi:hypothetical protein
MAESAVFTVGDRVRVRLDGKYWRTAGWFDGTIVRIDPYTAHRSFHWVELDTPVQDRHGGRASMVSILNPQHIVRI